MDTRWKSYSHSLKSYSHSIFTKIIVFIIMIACFIGAIKQFVEVEVINDGDIGIVFEKDYFQSESYVRESESILFNLTRLVGEFKNEEHILNGGTFTEDELRVEEENLYSEFQYNSRSYSPEQTEEKNYETFKAEYGDKISQVREQLIRNDLKEYHLLLQDLNEVKDPFYYISDGVNEYANSPKLEKNQLKDYPSYMLFEEFKQEFYPKAIKENDHLFFITDRINETDMKGTVAYVAFSDDFLNSKIKEWKADKEKVTRSFYQLIIFFAGFILTFINLVLVIGRNSFKGGELHLNTFDRLYNDIKSGP